MLSYAYIYSYFDSFKEGDYTLALLTSGGFGLIKLQGNRIYLATLERADCRRIYEDREYDFTHITGPLMMGSSIEKSDDWFFEIQNAQGSEIRLGIFLKDGTVIGDIALHSISWKDRLCAIGYDLTKLEYRNKGYMTEAARLIIEYGFFIVGMEKIEANVLEGNIASCRVLEKCGFVLEGTERKVRYFAGKRHDRFLFGLFPDEFQATRSQDGK